MYRIAVLYSIRSSYPGLYLLYCIYRLRIREREIQLYVNYTTDKYVLSDIIISTCHGAVSGKLNIQTEYSKV